MAKEFNAVPVPRKFHELVRALEKEAVSLGVHEARGLDTAPVYTRLSLVREALYKYASKKLRGRRKDDVDPTYLRF